MAGRTRATFIPPTSSDDTSTPSGSTTQATGDGINAGLTGPSEQASNETSSQEPSLPTVTPVVPTLTPTTTTPSATDTIALNHGHLLEAFAALTDADRQALVNALPPAAKAVDQVQLIVPTTTVAALPLLFTEDQEIPRVTDATGEVFNDPGTHPVFRTLALHRCHAHLGLFLTKSIDHIFLNHQSLATVQINDPANKNKIRVLDTTAAVFPPEASLTPGQWTEAWSNFLTFLRTNASPAVYRRFENHFTYCWKKQNFEKMFQVILTFDIAIRRGYTAAPTPFDEVTYRRHWESVLSEYHTDTMARFSAFAERHVASVARSSPSANHRTEPYSRDQSSSPSKPQRTPRTPSAASPPICLICARLGHRFSECQHQEMEGGKATGSRFAEGKLVLKTSAHTPLISAPSAAPLPTTLVPVPVFNGDDVLGRIITPYNANSFSSALERAGLSPTYPDLVRKLREGFPISLTPPTISKTFTPANHPSARRHHQVVWDYMVSERDKNRMSGPYTIEELERIVGGPFRSSPIHVVEKAGALPTDPIKYRITINLSFKDENDFSVNDGIDSDDFPTRWGGAADMADFISSAPPGAEVATLDIEAAFRGVPLRPDQKKFTVVQCDGFWLDHCCSFGCSSSGGNQDELADAIVDILAFDGVKPTEKWVDDFATGRIPHAGGTFTSKEPENLGFTYLYDLTRIKTMTADLGVPWHKTKGSDFSTSFRYVGFDFNIPDRHVSLPAEKRLKLKTKVDSFLASAESSRVTLAEVWSLIGSLSHAAFVHPSGRAYLPGLSSWSTKFESRLQRRYPPSAVITDLRWWSHRLAHPYWRRSLTPPSPLQDIDLWVDASTDWGIGLIWGDCWDAWRLTDQPRSRSQDIGWLEALAVEFALLTLEAHGVRNTHVLIRSDNQGVIGAWAKGRGRNFDVNLSIRRADMPQIAQIPSPEEYWVPIPYKYRELLSFPIHYWRLSPMSDTAFFKLILAHVGADTAAGHRLLNPVIPPQYSPPALLEPALRLPRRPLPGNEYCPSPFRPNCLASERLFKWTTPCTIPYRSMLALDLGVNDATALIEVQIFHLDDKTRSNYAAGLLRFTQYCDSRRIPEATRMPAFQHLLCSFVTVMGAAQSSRSTVDNWLAGLRFWHELNGAPWLGANGLRITKGAVAKLVPESSIRPRRPPVTIEHLHHLYTGLDLTSPFDAAVWALACTAFWSCCRLGELLLPSANAFDPVKHVARGTTMSFHDGPSGVRSAFFHIPWTKVTHRAGADIIVTSIDDPSDAWAALRLHLDVNAAVPASAPFFAYTLPDGAWRPLTRSAFMDRCETVWHAAGLPLLLGHAFRIGGATELLLRGTPPDVVAVQGRWKSRAFLEYWRKIEGILPLFITNSFREARAALATQTMDVFSRGLRHAGSSSH